MAVIFGMLFFFGVVLLTLILGYVGNRADVEARRRTQRDVLTGHDRDVTVRPDANDRYLNTPV